MKRCSAMVFVVAGLLGGCAESDFVVEHRPAAKVVVTPPDWVSGQSAKYTPALFLTGRGEARSLEQAQNQARADLAKFFEVAVRETGIDLQQFTSASTSGKEGQDQDLQQSVSRQLVTYTDRVLHGVEIADQWRDPETGTFYALATASKPQTIERLRDEINRLDDDTQKHIDRARQAERPLARIAAASRAVKTQQQRAAVQRSLQTLDPSGQGIAPRWSLVSLRADRDAVIERTRLKVVLDNPPPGFSSTFGSALAHAGFRVGETAAPDYVLTAVLKLDPSFTQEGWLWQRGQIVVTLAEPNGTVVGNKQWPVKASSQQSDMLHARVLDQSAKLLEKELADALVGFSGE